MFGQSLLSAFGIACTTDTDQLFNPTSTQINSLATYQLNNATTSIPSNTYPGTASNITYSTGKFGNAAVFSGNSKITLDNTAFRLSTQTISLWINSSDYNPNCTLYDGGLDNNGTLWGGVAIGAQANKVYYYGGDPTGTGGSGFFHVTGTTNITNGTWVHIALVVNGTSITGYVNGLQDTGLSRTLGANIPYYGLPGFYLGVRSGNFGSHGWFNGTIDQVRIFNTALSQTAVTALYNETTTTAQNAYITEEAYSGIAYYKMSDATDQLGNYNGTATNVNFNTEGKFGFAGAFNGSSSKIVLPTTTIDSIKSNGSFGVSAWFKTSETGDRKFIFSAFQGSYLMLEVTSGNQLKGTVSNSVGTNTELTVPITVTDGNWHHAVFTGNNGSLYLYLDNGTPQTSSSWNGTFFSGTGGIGIGIRMASSDYWDGDIDQIRIYDSALSAANVSTLYKEVECEPAAINALDYFNTVIYTGSGGTESISTVGFKPGLTWIKNRDNAYSHQLYDTVRGTGSSKNLQSDNDKVQGNDANLYGFLSSFDTNGYTVQSGTSSGYNNIWTNQSGQDYVAWNWKAAFANLSTSFNGSSSFIDLNLKNQFKGTVSIWFNGGTPSAQCFLYASTAGSSGNKGIALLPQTNGTIRVLIGQGTSGTFALDTYTTDTFFDSNWHNAVLTWDLSISGTNVYLYVDNVVKASGPATTGNWTTGQDSTSDLFLGHYNNSGGSQTFNGKIGQVRIFNDILTTSEISDLYIEPVASNNTLNYPAGAGCIAAYPLQTDAVDLSGNYSGSSSNVTFGQPGYLTGNTDGAITSTVAANQEAGFSIVQWSSSGGVGTVGHGLNKTPELIIIKKTASTSPWSVYAAPVGNSKRLQLNESAAAATDNMWNNTTPTNKVFTQQISGGATTDNIGYCFTSIPGYSQIGSYIGNGASNTIYTGFEPKFVMQKRTNSSGSWNIIDNKRGDDNYLSANLSNAEGSMTAGSFTLTSTGFILNNSFSEWNTSGGEYIYLAIA